MIPTDFPPPLTLEQMPAVINGFVADLSTCQSHIHTQHLLQGLSYQEKSIIFAACSSGLQQRLWQMRKESAA